MNNTNNKHREDRSELVMMYESEKFTVPSRPETAPVAPMYSSPWLALYFHLKANLNQSSTS